MAQEDASPLGAVRDARKTRLLSLRRILKDALETAK